LGSEKQVSFVRFSKDLPGILWYQPPEGFLVYFHIYLINYSTNIMILLHDDLCIGIGIDLSWSRRTNTAVRGPITRPIHYIFIN
jgi:hypothetical protein